MYPSIVMLRRQKNYTMPLKFKVSFGVTFVLDDDDDDDDDEDDDSKTY